MKNFTITFLLIFLFGCGYTPVYDKQNIQDIRINVVNIKGDNSLNNEVKNQLKLYSNKNSGIIYNTNLYSDYKKIVISKNSAGIVTDYEIIGTVKITTERNGKTNSFEFKESIKMKKNNNSFDQENYERTIRKNFATSIRQKFITQLLNINDN